VDTPGLDGARRRRQHPGLRTPSAANFRKENRIADREDPPFARDGLSGEVKEANGGDAGGIVEARSTKRSPLRTSEKR
jgi:hypothetical protein